MMNLLALKCLFSVWVSRRGCSLWMKPHTINTLRLCRRPFVPQTKRSAPRLYMLGYFYSLVWCSEMLSQLLLISVKVALNLCQNTVGRSCFKLNCVCFFSLLLFSGLIEGCCLGALLFVGCFFFFDITATETLFSLDYCQQQRQTRVP